MQVTALADAAYAAYGAVHVVSCFTEGLYKDLKGLGAKVSASVLCPGLVRTGILEAERNRPADYGPATDVTALAPGVRALAEQFRAALETGFEPAVVAQAVVSAIQQDQYYIIPAQPKRGCAVSLSDPRESEPC